MNHQITTELLNSAIVALFPETADDSPATPGPTRNAEGSLNPQAWSQVLCLFLWFGFNATPLHLELLASALQEDPRFPKLLALRPSQAVFRSMSKTIEKGLPIGECVFAVNSLRSSVEAMAEVLRESGEAFDSRALPQLREAIDGLDEMINKRIEGEKA